MRPHEVPTHVQAEDRVLLGFTFPQIVAVTAVCALSYGIYRYAPVGPQEVRLALAVLLGLPGIAMVVGKVGGRRLPLVAADLLKYRLGSRRYAGPLAELVRSAPPAPPRPPRSGPGPLRLLSSRMRRTLRELRTRRRGGERRNGRRLLRPRRWFIRRGAGAPAHPRGGILRSLAAAAVLLGAAASAAPPILADDGWRDEIGFELQDPVPGRRLFVEQVTVTEGSATVTLRAATDLDIRVRAYGGPGGNRLRFWSAAALAEGGRAGYSLPLDGPAPSLTFSWEDGLGQAGAFTLKDAQLPHPLPEAQGEVCDLRLISLGWTPGTIEGVVQSTCAAQVEEPARVELVAGHAAVTRTMVVDAAVTAVTGTLTAEAGGSRAAVPFVPNGRTRFRLPVADGTAVHEVSVGVELDAALQVPMPPLVRLTHRPERTEQRTSAVGLWRPGASQVVSETVSVACGDGTTTQHTVSATLTVPGQAVDREVTFPVVHAERIEAEVVERAPAAASRSESFALSSAVGSDEPFRVLVLPEAEPERPLAGQEPAPDELRDWFALLGLEWMW